jgi:hypothetical protein
MVKELQKYNSSSIIFLSYQLKSKYNEFKMLKRLNKPNQERLKSLKKIAKNKLIGIEFLFPEFTKHDISHSNTLVKIFEMIIPEFLKDKFNEYEIFFLLSAAYFHDVGMALLQKELDDPEINNLTGDKLKNSIRERHHIRSNLYIQQNYQSLGFVDHHQAYIVGKICKGHRDIDLSEFETNFAYKNNSINIALLTLLLRIADELDLTFERIQGKSGIPADEIAELHFKKHLSISGVVKDQKDPLTIKCSVVCKELKIHRILRKIELKINNQIRLLPNYLGNYNQVNNIIPRYFKMTITPKGYLPYDFKFTIEDKDILQLLGNQLYTKTEYSIREILKNSIDACRIKKKIYEQEQRTYVPFISFTLSDDRIQLKIEDNGIGMDASSIKNFLTKIGKSYYESPEFKNLDLDFSPLSELGIGILSYFKIAEKIEIETKKDGDDPSLKVSIEELDNYFYVEPTNRTDTGTTLTLTIKEHLKVQFERPDLEEREDIKIYSAFFGEPIFYERLYIKELIKIYARHIEIPIIVKHAGNEEVIIEKQFDLKFIPEEDVFVYPINIDENYVTGVVVLIQKNPYTQLKINFDDKSFVSYEGVFVRDRLVFRHISLKLIYYYDLNFKHRSIFLNLSRDSIPIGQQNYNTIGKIEVLILKHLPRYIKGYIEFLKKRNIHFEPHLRKIFDSLNYQEDDFYRELIDQEDDFYRELIDQFLYLKIVKDRKLSFEKYSALIQQREDIKVLNIDEANNFNIHYVNIDGEIGKSDLIRLINKLTSSSSYDSTVTYLINDFTNLPIKDNFKDCKTLKSSEL